MSIPKDAKGGHANTPSAAVRKAARWLATTPDDRRPRPLVPPLRKTFDLTPGEAITAIQEANIMRARAA